MPRYPSESSIRRRALIAYHRAQAIARNTAYGADIATLQARGYTFSANGVENYVRGPRDAFSPLAWQARAIRKRTGLTRLMLPDRLRTLTLEEIENYDRFQLFEDVPGWTLERTHRPEPSAVRVPDPFAPDGVRLYVRRPVGIRRLSQRHRETTYAECWRVYDAWEQYKHQRRWEARVIQTVWPKEKSSRGDSFEKNALRQRVYDRLKRAKKLILSAYQP